VSLIVLMFTLSSYLVPLGCNLNFFKLASISANLTNVKNVGCMLYSKPVTQPTTTLNIPKYSSLPVIQPTASPLNYTSSALPETPNPYVLTNPAPSHGVTLAEKRWTDYDSSRPVYANPAVTPIQRSSMGPEITREPAPINANTMTAESLRCLGSIIQQGFSLPKRSVPTFNGNPLEYFAFTKGFQETILDQVASPASHPQYLLEMCVGQAREVIKSCTVISPASAGLRQALDLLYENFGQKHIVVDAHFNSICKGPPVKSDQQSLSELATEMTNCQIVMKEWGFGSLLDSPQTLESVFKRLPIHLQKMFCNKVEINSDEHLATFEELTGFVKQAVQRSNTFFGKIVAKSMATKMPRQRQQTPSRVFANQVAAINENYDSTVTKERTACVSCNGNHALYKCDNFRKLPVHERWNLVKSKKNCFNCEVTCHENVKVIIDAQLAISRTIACCTMTAAQTEAARKRHVTMSRVRLRSHRERRSIMRLR